MRDNDIQTHHQSIRIATYGRNASSSKELYTIPDVGCHCARRACRMCSMIEEIDCSSNSLLGAIAQAHPALQLAITLKLKLSTQGIVCVPTGSTTLLRIGWVRVYTQFRTNWRRLKEVRRQLTSSSDRIFTLQRYASPVLAKDQWQCRWPWPSNSSLEYKSRDKKSVSRWSFAKEFALSRSLPHYGRSGVPANLKPFLFCRVSLDTSSKIDRATVLPFPMAHARCCLSALDIAYDWIRCQTTQPPVSLLQARWFAVFPCGAHVHPTHL